MRLSLTEAVLLDVDGTLIDTVPDLAYCVDKMLFEFGFSPCGEDKVRNWVGSGIDSLVRQALANAGNTGLEPNTFKRALRLFMRIYAENTARHSRLYPGVEEGLNFLRQNGYRLGCVTNKRTCFTEVLLQTLGIYDDFEIVICGDTLPKRKPDPLPLLHAANFFSVNPEDSLMVGDSINDIGAARAAGFNVICVSYGYNCGMDIQDAEPDAVIDSLIELADHLTV